MKAGAALKPQKSYWCISGSVKSELCLQPLICQLSGNVWRQRITSLLMNHCFRHSADCKDYTNWLRSTCRGIYQSRDSKIFFLATLFTVKFHFSSLFIVLFLLFPFRFLTSGLSTVFHLSASSLVATLQCKMQTYDWKEIIQKNDKKKIPLRSWTTFHWKWHMIVGVNSWKD